MSILQLELENVRDVSNGYSDEEDKVLEMQVNPNVNVSLIMEGSGLNENFTDFVFEEFEESFENKDNGKYVRCSSEQD